MTQNVNKLVSNCPVTNPMYSMASILQGLVVTICLRSKQVVESKRPAWNCQRFQIGVEYLK